jgi:hypothetical protein
MKYKPPPQAPPGRYRFLKTVWVDRTTRTNVVIRAGFRVTS